MKKPFGQINAGDTLRRVGEDEVRIKINSDQVVVLEAFKATSDWSDLCINISKDEIIEVVK